MTTISFSQRDATALMGAILCFGAAIFIMLFGFAATLGMIIREISGEASQLEWLLFLLFGGISLINLFLLFLTAGFWLVSPGFRAWCHRWKKFTLIPVGTGVVILSYWILMVVTAPA